VSTLIRIKRLAYKGKVSFSVKAANEMRREHLDPDLVIEAILNAPAIAKKIRSSDPLTGKREYLYVLIGKTFTGLVLYTKGKIRVENGEETLYLLISSKRSIG
jgi:hypothetical protein